MPEGRAQTTHKRTVDTGPVSTSATSFVETRARSRTVPVEIVVCLIVFAAFCVAVLTKTAQMLEPDDFAYRASIVALTHGHILLTNAQYTALNHQLAASGGQGILQWHHLATGMWVSEKNPGYPFFAVVFYLLGLLRVTPLFWGALACVSASSWAHAAGSAAGRESGRSCSTARRAPRWSLPGGPPCPRSPTPRSSQRGPAACCG